MKKLLSEKVISSVFRIYLKLRKCIMPFHRPEQRVFGEILEDKGQYPEDTLAKKLKKYLMDGKNPGDRHRIC